MSVEALPGLQPPSAGAPRARRPLGETLITRGVLSEDQLRIALMEQKARNQPLGKVLVSLGFLTEATLREVLAENLGHREIDLARLVPSPQALALIPRDVAKRLHVFPVSADEAQRTLTIATPNPNDVVALDQLNALLRAQWRLVPAMAAEGDISSAIDTHYGHELSIDGILHEIETGEVDLRSLDGGREYSGPIVRLVDSILADAVQRRASDIHFEPEPGFVRIRYRIDGVMRQIRALHAKYWQAMLVRLKIVSGMNIAESRAPQDGRIGLILNGRPIDFRAAAQPTLHGENVVLRVLDRARGLVPLEKMGLTPDQLETIETMVSRPEGIILVTGPTGSGKTTTLYSLLIRISDERVNVMTLEDPVEYPLPMIRQTNIAAGLKIEFASGIRSLMRQDPDVIMVGEIRDSDTATMALRAAMTGHQVYSTLHTNSAIGAIPRLIDLGLAPDLMAGNLIGVIGQRLVRKLCVHCRAPYEVDEDVATMMGIPEGAPRVLHRAAGCVRCEHQGYSGRLALQEILRFDEDLDDLLARRASIRDMLVAARAKGFRSLADDAIRRVVEGATSLDEAARVVDLTRIGAFGAGG